MVEEAIRQECFLSRTSPRLSLAFPTFLPSAFRHESSHHIIVAHAVARRPCNMCTLCSIDESLPHSVLSHSCSNNDARPPLFFLANVSR